MRPPDEMRKIKAELAKPKTPTWGPLRETWKVKEIREMFIEETTGWTDRRVTKKTLVGWPS